MEKINPGDWVMICDNKHKNYGDIRKVITVPKGWMSDLDISENEQKAIFEILDKREVYGLHAPEKREEFRLKLGNHAYPQIFLLENQITKVNKEVGETLYGETLYGERD